MKVRFLASLSFGLCSGLFGAITDDYSLPNPIPGEFIESLKEYKGLVASQLNAQCVG